MTSTWAAPGRVNLIGEHVDYNDGPVLPFALPQVTSTRATARAGATVTVLSRSTGAAEFAVATSPGEVVGWSAYVAGVVWALRQQSFDVPGLDLTIWSDVPVGAGLSSSAALTCSVAAAIDDEAGFGMSPEQTAEVARAAENGYVGVPTGAMDQLASMLCSAGHALLLDCRSMQTRQINLDPVGAGLALLLIDTGARHELAGSEYADRRADCERAAADLGLTSLRDAEPDAIDSLAPRRLRRRARHVISEITRVGDVVTLLEADRMAEIGPLLSASHASLRDDFEVSTPELDVAVDGALAAGALGARLVGGGFGGCAIALCHGRDEPAVRHSVRTAYGDRGWRVPEFSSPTPSPGARRIR